MQKESKVLIFIVLLLVGAGVTLNQLEKLEVDQSKLPSKVEDSKGFQRWLTNLKNKDFDIEADEFRLVEENEIYNTKWMTVNSVDQEGVQEEYDKILAEKLDDKNKVVFSPSKRQFVDYKNEARGFNPNTEEPYQSNEIFYYGLREDKVISARFLDCSIRANCYFDRAYFLEDSNDVFVVSEFSRNIDKKDVSAPECGHDEACTYTIKVHIVDMINNSRLIYESEPFDGVLDEMKTKL